MNTDDLILRLASDARPVVPLRPPAVRLLGWLVLAVACAGAAVWIFGLRPDAATMAGSRGFLLDAALAALVLVGGAGAALLQAVPGAERRPIVRALAVAALTGWIALLLLAVVEQGQGFAGAGHWTVCASRVLAVTVIPAIGLFRLVARGAPLRPGWAAALAGAAAAAAGALAVQLTCPLADPAHVLLGHAGPVAAAAWIAASGAVLMRRQDRAVYQPPTLT